MCHTTSQELKRVHVYVRVCYDINGTNGLVWIFAQNIPHTVPNSFCMSTKSP
eukprot:m.368961 g.368961  ORF g.368961 m.368961 type:complete len:52 (-) comp47068_c0_seq1:550-705(-)